VLRGGAGWNIIRLWEAGRNILLAAVANAEEAIAREHVAAAFADQRRVDER
jgi:hypothetical protein